MAQANGSRELELVAVAVGVTLQVGGNLAGTLDSIAGTLRERLRIQGKIASLTAQGRMQARVVALLPVALGLALAWLRPDLVDPMMEHSFGWALIFLVFVLDVLGLYFVRRIVAVEV
jgi:tight adherence protein B